MQNTTQLLNRKRAAEWLAQQLGDKDADQWKLWLRNNANTARKAVYRVETSTVGRSTFYSLDELARFLDWEKSRRIGEMKLDGRALEVMQAFGIGDPNVSGTTGRKLEVVALNAQHDEVQNVAFIQLTLSNPLRVYRLELADVKALAAQLTEAYDDAVHIQGIIDREANK